MIHAQVYSDNNRQNFGYEIWEGSNLLHMSECLYTKEIALKISESVVTVLNEFQGRGKAAIRGQ